MNPISVAIVGRDWFKNIISSRSESYYSQLFYVTEPVDWVIKWVGIDLTLNLQKQRLLKTRITTTCKGISHQIIHFGSEHALIQLNRIWKPHKSNRVVLTWFHVVPNDPKNERAAEVSNYVDVVHTASSLTKEDLLELGFPEDKIVSIPLGVDLNIFKPLSIEEKPQVQEKLGVPQDKIVIGSFQKDGVGWGDGLEPKWVKGPDVFVEVVEKLKKDYDIFALLVGPARGYVRRELEKRAIPYKHTYLNNYLEILNYYHALDLYIITSRVEGGPKALVESMATGVPIVSTKVGMAPEIIKDGYNGFLAEVEDVETLSEKARIILTNEHLKTELVKTGLETVRNYSWEKIAARYYEEIYKKLQGDKES